MTGQVKRPWKHIVFVAGVIGVFGLFVPLLEIRHDLVAVRLTAKELTFGLEGAHAMLNARLPKLVERRIPAAIRSGREDARMVAHASRYAALMYIPAGLLLVLGLAGLATRRRFGRVHAALALVFGLAAITAFIGLRVGVQVGVEELGLKRTTVTLLNGAFLLVIAGLGGAVAGVGALVKPEQTERR
ncbi:MAG: hypothetical protein WKG01_34845 [Kofleriaceae bacterium]